MQDGNFDRTEGICGLRNELLAWLLSQLFGLGLRLGLNIEHSPLGLCIEVSAAVVRMTCFNFITGEKHWWLVVVGVGLGGVKCG